MDVETHINARIAECEGECHSYNAWLRRLLVMRSRYYSMPRKLAQCFIVWAIPAIGPTAIWAFLRAQGHAEIFDTRTYPEPSQRAVAVEVSNAIHDSFGGDGGTSGGGGGD